MQVSMIARRRGTGEVVHITQLVFIRRDDDWPHPPGWFPHSPRWGVPPATHPGVSAFLDALADLLYSALPEHGGSDDQADTGAA